MLSLHSVAMVKWLIGLPFQSPCLHSTILNYKQIDIYISEFLQAYCLSRVKEIRTNCRWRLKQIEIILIDVI